ncbi:hypothetical protein J2S00_003126 [Caldalkalibacillus uzonensis]|uniref:Spore protein n=1 Tax=Caldalkalibacillus uzonensis TaxID=353224 RepID=A0ABU0CW05_9BACI|nr:hypothetical protein [Caldalkalibacillus uzonensis]MDQ0340317.1 hypothetical protein [Caldalkalibacillus uzonensis]
MEKQNHKPDPTDSLEQKQKKEQPSANVNLSDKKLSGPNRPST